MSQADEKTSAMPHPLSVCIIARNDAARIEGCLRSVQEISPEVIVVDTGSTDATAQIAGRCGARVEHFTWCDDFSAARNFSLKSATGDWILVLDTDEALAPGQASLLQELTARTSEFGYRCRIRNALPNGGEFISLGTRLFRNEPRIRFVGRVHEQIDQALHDSGHRASLSEVTILHSGYGVDESTNRGKAARNLKGLLLDLKDDPNNTFVALKIGQLYITSGEPDRAVEYLRRGVLASDPALAAEGYNSLAGMHAARHEFEPALRACAESIARVPYQRMGYVIISQILNAMGRLHDAEAQLGIARSITGPSHLYSDLPAIPS
jgi:glycosyltransferase involved in cell wall biosynthesis